jgi:hypothetical protein
MSTSRPDRCRASIIQNKAAVYRILAHFWSREVQLRIRVERIVGGRHGAAARAGEGPGALHEEAA